MPELPDVETFKRYLDSTALHQKVTGVRVADARVLKGVSKSGLGRAIEGRKFTSTRRHGKHLFARLSGDGWLRLHFGMTGFLDYGKDEGEPPEHAQVTLSFAGGHRLAYLSKRKLGEVGLVDDPGGFAESEDLGPDLLGLGLDAFRERLGSRRGSIKNALMNQSLVAGLGNVYSDEALYQAGLHPRAEASELDARTLARLHRALERVLRVTIRHQAQPEDFPEGYLTRHREEGARCPRCKGKVKRISISGRHTYFCPGCQSRGG